MLTSIVVSAWFMCAAVAATLSLLFLFEGVVGDMPFVAVVIAVLFAIFFLLSARPAFSIHAAIAVSVVVCLVSTVKYTMKGFDLHIYDLVFTGADPEAYRFLGSKYLYLVMPVAVVMAASIVFVAFVGWTERRGAVRLRARLGMLAVACLALPLTYPLGPNQPRYFHYLGGYNASAFYVSFLDLQYLFRRSEFSDRLGNVPPQPALADTVDCGDAKDRPDLFFVLSESRTDPSYFPQLDLGGAFDDHFRSQDGKRHPPFVETFGGGTWISSLSVMTGLSSAEFGFQSPYLTTVLEGKIDGALPEVLARCGYRTVAILPMKYSFVNEGPFLASIGFETVLDYNAIGATKYAHRDSFCYQVAERFIAEHRETDGRPLFLSIQTMFPHSPYTDGEVDASMPAPPTIVPDPETDEYLRRIQVSRADFSDFLAARAQQPSERGTVVLEYGDHQSFVTKQLVDELAGSQSLADLGSLAYKTYFSVHSYNHTVDMAVFGDGPIDIGYLGSALVEAAQLPTSPMYRSLIALRDHCGGLFHLCADRKAVDEHLRQRMDSGLLRAS